MNFYQDSSKPSASKRNLAITGVMLVIFLYALAFIVVGVLFPPEQRAKMQGIISSIWGISSILGPLAGGLIVEYTNWRWVFFVNLPITAISIGLIVVGLKEEKAERHTPKLD